MNRLLLCFYRHQSFMQTINMLHPKSDGDDDFYLSNNGGGE